MSQLVETVFLHSKNQPWHVMKRKIKIADYLLEISATTVVITLFLLDTISFGYAVLGIVLSLSLMWPIKTKKTHT